MYVPRKLFPHELDKYQEHLFKLRQESRNLRFGFPIQNDGIMEFINTIKKDPDNHAIFVIEDDNLNIIGVGHIGINDMEIELGFSVLDTYQGKGLGSTLMARCLEWCRNRGYKKGYMVCLQHNSAIKHLASKHGLVLHTEYGETQADIDLPDATVLSVLNEIMTANLSYFDYFSKTGRKLSKITKINIPA